MAENMRKKNLREFKPSQSMGQDGRKNSFTSGESSDTLSGKNVLKEYRPGGMSKGALGAKNTAS